MYPRTFTYWNKLHPGDTGYSKLMGAFLESVEFDRFREMPFAGKGISIEEAFFLFQRRLAKVRLQIVENEFFAALMRALVFSNEPAFEIEDPRVKRLKQGAFVVVEHDDAITLFAAANGNVIQGAITPLIAWVLQKGVEDARRHFDVPEEELTDVVERLEKLGLL